MGTRSTTVIKDEAGNPIVNIYRQCDGYFSVHGRRLAEILKATTLVDGLGVGRSTKGLANGMGCLAAQIVSQLKDGRAGNIYLVPLRDREEFNYTVFCENGEIRLKVEDSEGVLLFIGTPGEFLQNLARQEG